MKFKQFSLFVFTLAIGVMLFNSCRKDVVTNTPQDVPSLLRQEFEKLQVEKSLTSRYNDSLNISWYPNWTSIQTKKGKNNVDVYFIPLRAGLVSIKNAGRNYSVSLVRFEQYLIAYQQADKKVVFFKAKYIREQANGQQNMRSASGYTNFSGWAVLDDLHGKTAVISYNDGIKLSGNTSGTGRSVSASGSPVTICDQECTWTAYCSGGRWGSGNHTISHTIGKAGANCQEPSDNELPSCEEDGSYVSGWMAGISHEFNCFTIYPDPEFPLPGGDPSTYYPVPGGKGYNDLAADQQVQFAILNGLSLEEHLKCFQNIPDDDARFTVKLCAYVPVKSDPYILVNNNFKPGHVFITMTKSNFAMSVSQSIGFYPNKTFLSIGMGAIDSKLVDDGRREYDAEIIMEVDRIDFETVMYAMRNYSALKYDLNDYNCADFGIDVFNSIRYFNPVQVPDRIGQNTGINFGTTPNELYETIRKMQNNGDPNARTGVKYAPEKKGPCID